MKNAMRKGFILMAMLAIALAIGFTFVSCDDGGGARGGYDSGGGGGSGGLAGTYYYDDSWWITFSSNGRFNGYDGRNGTYSVNGSYIYLSRNFYGSTWRIYSSTIVYDGDNDPWYKR